MKHSMKRLLSILLCLCMVLSILPATALATDGSYAGGIAGNVSGGSSTGGNSNGEDIKNDYFEGGGTEQEPVTGGYTYDEANNTYTVYNADGLYAWAEAATGDPSTSLTLANDIVMPNTDANGNEITISRYFVSGSNWNMLPSSAGGFSGTIDGAGHAIVGLRMTDSENNTAFINNLSASGTIKNLHFKNAAVNPTYPYARAAVIVVYNYGTITDCSVDAESFVHIQTNRTQNMIGGIAAQSRDGSFTANCINRAYIRADGKSPHAGGIIGNGAGTISGCQNYGDIYGESSVGGIVGFTGHGDVDTIISNCANYGNLTERNPISYLGEFGGIVGFGSEAKVYNCMNVGSISVHESNTDVGGINGWKFYEEVHNCYYLNSIADETGLGTKKSASDFRNGNVANLLGSGWAQNDIDPYPVPCNASEHAKKSFTYEICAGDNTKHNKIYNCCGTMFTEAHSGGEAICTSGAICEACGNEYTDAVACSYDSATGKCKWCGTLAAAKVGDTCYCHFSDALDAWANDTTLTLMDDVVCNGNIDVQDKLNIVLDLNGKTLASDADTFFEISNCILTIKDSVGTGIIENTSGGCVVSIFGSQASVELAGGKLLNTAGELNCCVLIEGGASFLQSGGIIDRDVHVINGVYEMTGGNVAEGVEVDNNGEFILSGGNVGSIQLNGGNCILNGGNVDGGISCYDDFRLHLEEDPNPEEYIIYGSSDNFYEQISLPDGYVLMDENDRYVSAGEEIVLHAVKHTHELTRSSDGNAVTHKTVCNCGYEARENHTGGTYTCIELAKCEYCNQSYGIFASHNYDLSTGKCTVCGEKACYYINVDGETFYDDNFGEFSAFIRSRIIEGSVYNVILDIPSDEVEDFVALIEQIGRSVSEEIKLSVYCDNESFVEGATEFAGDTFYSVTILHDGGEATCAQKAVCERCGEQYGNLATDNHRDNTNTTLIDLQDGTHGVKCSECEQVITSAKHTGGKATCTERAVCEICGYHYGDLKPHNYNQDTGKCYDCGNEASIIVDIGFKLYTDDPYEINDFFHEVYILMEGFPYNMIWLDMPSELEWEVLEEIHAGLAYAHTSMRYMSFVLKCTKRNSEAVQWYLDHDMMQEAQYEHLSKREYSNNGDGTHAVSWPCCGEVINSKEYHRHDKVKYQWEKYSWGVYVNATLECVDCDEVVASGYAYGELINTVEGTNCRNPGTETYSATFNLDGVDYTDTHTFTLKSDNHVGTFDNGFCSVCSGYEKPEYREEDNTFLISNAGELYWFADYIKNADNYANAVITADITIPAGMEWIPLGNDTSYFCGSLDGGYHTISGLHCSGGEYGGLIGRGYASEYKNIHITNSSFHGTNYSGAIAGYSEGIITNCFVDSSVTVTCDSGNAGMLVGENMYGSLTNCWAAGILCGNDYYGSYDNCYFLSDTEDDIDGTTAMSAADFASGKVAFLLQNGQQPGGYWDENDVWVDTPVPEVWGQTIGSDKYPVFGGAEVYEITIFCSSATAYSNVDEDVDHIDVDNNGYCDVCNTLMQDAKLMKYSISLNGNIAINFYMLLSEKVVGDPNAYMQFTMADGEVIKIPVSQGVLHDGYYVFTCEVAAKEMTDDVKCQFIYTDGYTEERAYSVKSYADYILAYSSNADLKDLITAMLHYGAAAQHYFGYKTNKLADEGLDAADYSGVSISGMNAGKVQGTTIATLYSASLILKSETTLRFFFKINGDASNFTATYNGQTLEVKQRSGLYYVDVTNIAAKALDQNVTIIINDGAEEAQVTYSPMDYCAVVQLNPTGSFEQEMVDLVCALYLYNQAAKKVL